LETLARTLRSRVRGESTLKGLVKGAQSRSSDASCEASLLLPFSFTFVDSLTVKRTSTELEAVARFLSLRSRALGESTLKGLVIGAHSFFSVARSSSTDQDASSQQRKLSLQLFHQLHGLVFQLPAFASADFSPLFVASVLLFDPFHRTRF
jgi:hypothetical protein